MYKTLVSDLNKLRLRVARFRRIALHLHSVRSHDWGKVSKADKSLNDRSNFEAPSKLSNFADALRPHLDLVAVTDHMIAGYGVELSKSLPTSDEFAVLPGIEVNFRPEAALAIARIHLLVIFRENTTLEHFSKLYLNNHDIPDDSDRTGQEEIAGVAIAEFVKHVHSLGGLCIPAHIENSLGIRKRFRQTALDMLTLLDDATDSIDTEATVGDQVKEYLFAVDVDAVEVHKSTDSPHFKWVSSIDGSAKEIATVHRFDAHCVEQFDQPKRVTCTSSKPFGQKVLKIKPVFGSSGLPFKLPFVGSVTAGAVRAYAV